MKGKKSVKGKLLFKGGSPFSGYDFKMVGLILAALIIGFGACYIYIMRSRKRVLIEEDVIVQYGGKGEDPRNPITQERPSTMNYPLQRPLKQVSLPVYPTSPPEYPLRGVHTGFQQVGVLVLNNQEFEKPDITIPEESPEKERLKNNMPEPVLLPLYGRKLETRNERWEYYCGSDKYNSMRLPVYYGNRDCQNDIGCNEIYDGDHVSVPDYGKQHFRARIYKYNVLNAV